jgi:hypothetical protein
MTKFRKYTDQDIVRLPISPDMKTNPFVMGCCSCGAAHKAYFNYTNDKLYVRMVPDAEWTEVFRTDDAAKEPEIFLTDSEVKPMRNSRRRFNDDSDFETVYDEFSGEYKKILRDGRSLHVSLEMKDALRRDDQAAREAKIADAMPRPRLQCAAAAPAPIRTSWVSGPPPTRMQRTSPAIDMPMPPARTRPKIRGPVWALATTPSTAPDGAVAGRR